MPMRSTAASAAFAGLLLVAAGCGSTGTDLNQVVNVDPLANPGSSADGGGSSVADPFAGAPGYSGGGGGDIAHNPGKSCMQNGCHGSGEAPAFLIGGTVYKDYAGTTPNPGVQIRVLDSSGNSASTTSDSNGNFYIRAGQGGVAFPAIVGARDATTTRPMVTQLTGNMGSCNQGGCHVPGGGPTTNTGDYYPIHVP
jgi:hypothetical protein